MITLIKITQILLVLWLVNQIMRLFRKPQQRTDTHHDAHKKRQQPPSSRFDDRGRDVEDADFEEVDDEEAWEQGNNK